jgi:replicative DNA helicase
LNKNPKPLPNSVENEMSVLGCLLIDKESLDVGMQQLKEKSFYDTKHKNIFKAISTLYKHNRTIDMVTVGSTLRDLNMLNETGGIGYLQILIDSVSTVENFTTYLSIVNEKLMLRELIKNSDSLISDCYNQKKTCVDLLNEFDRNVKSIIKNFNVDTKATTLEKSMSNIYEEMEERFSIYENGVPYPTGLNSIDKKVLGLHKNELAIIGGRPSTGKSSIMTQFAFGVARQNVRTLFVTLEMSTEGLRDRLVSQETMIEHELIRTGKFFEDESLNAKLAKFITEQKHKAPLLFYHCPGINLKQLKHIIHIEQPEFVFIDYAQLMGVYIKESQAVDMGRIIQTLKTLTGQYEIGIILGSQLSRAAERSGDANMSHLKATGALEESADLIMLLKPENKKNSPEEQKVEDFEKEQMSRLTLQIAKNRNGEAGQDIPLYFDKKILRFYE